MFAVYTYCSTIEWVHWLRSRGANDRNFCQTITERVCLFAEIRSQNSKLVKWCINFMVDVMLIKFLYHLHYYFTFLFFLCWMLFWFSTLKSDKFARCSLARRLAFVLFNFSFVLLFFSAFQLYFECAGKGVFRVLESNEIDIKCMEFSYLWHYMPVWMTLW